MRNVYVSWLTDDALTSVSSPGRAPRFDLARDRAVTVEAKGSMTLRRRLLVPEASPMFGAVGCENHIRTAFIGHESVDPKRQECSRTREKSFK